MKRRISFRFKCFLCLAPMTVGLAVFSILPFFRVVADSFISNRFKGTFVWFDNYISVLGNEYYRLAVLNTLKLILCCVPVYVAGALFIVLITTRLRLKIISTLIRVMFILPIVIPTAGVVTVFKIMFEGAESPLPIYILFVWKNIGFAVLLFSAAITTIEGDIFEAAKLDGASSFRICRSITIPMIKSPILVVTLLGIVFCFRIYRESRIFYGSDYPPDYSYTLQYYMNNHFSKLNYQNLAVSAVLSTLVVVLLIVITWLLRRNSIDSVFTRSRLKRGAQS